MSTPTPPLARRVVLLGVLVVGIVLLSVNSVIYVALRASLLSSVDDLLAERVDAVAIEQRQQAVSDPGQLARRLQARGLRAVVTTAQGDVFAADPTSPLLGSTLPPDVDGGFDSRELRLADGTTVEVFARTSGVSSTLNRLLGLQLATSVLGLGVAAILLSRASSRALRPVREIAGAARRTASGERGARLRPDQPDTELGQMALAYDEMLDALEAGMKVAASLEHRGSTFELRWRQVLGAAQEAYVAVDGDGVVSDWNQQAQELFGWSRLQALGRSATDLVPEAQRHLVTETLQRMREQDAQVGATRFELPAVARSGSVFTAEAIVWGVDRQRDGSVTVHVFVRDVSLRALAEQSSARLAAVIDGSADAICIQDLDGRILTWNAAAERIHGWTAREAVGADIGLVVPEADLPAHREMIARVARDGPVPGYEGDRLTRGGDLVPVSVRLAPVRDSRGEVVAASSIARDITEQRFLSSTLDTTLVTLEAALGDATASEERTRQFLADAAHQLRTPIAGIRACAETLLRGVPSEAGDELLATMVRETSRAARLVTSLLQMARLDQGAVPDAVEVDLTAVCRDELDRTQVLAPHLAVALTGDAPALAHADATSLREVLANLLDNARRHARTSIEVRLETAGEEVHVLVADDGPGVPPDRVGRVFERFVSLDGLGGSGLGLPIARGLARAMGGELSYAEGFRLVVPAAPGPSPSAR